MGTEPIYTQLGFDINSTNDFVVNGPGTSGTLTSKNCVNFVPVSSIYIMSNIIRADETNDTNILQEIYGTNGVPYSNLVYQCNQLEMYAKNLNQSASNIYEFHIVDASTLKPLDTNGLPIYVTLQIFKDRDTDTLMRQLLKMLALQSAASDEIEANKLLGHTSVEPEAESGIATPAASGPTEASAGATSTASPEFPKGIPAALILPSALPTETKQGFQTFISE
jgi:hypothetical protein